jgi:fatty acid desaturase
MKSTTKNADSNATTRKPGLSDKLVDLICAVLLMIGIALIAFGHFLGSAACIWSAIPFLLASAIFASLHRFISVMHCCMTFGLVLLSIGLALHVG